jgi:hypothetical protein
MIKNGFDFWITLDDRFYTINPCYSFDWAYFFQTFSRYTGPLL